MTERRDDGEEALTIAGGTTGERGAGGGCQPQGMHPPG